LIEEIGDPDAPADVVVGYFEVSILVANGGFASHLAPLLSGKETLQERGIDFETWSVSFGWSTSYALVSVGAVVAASPVKCSLVEISQTSDLPADFVQEVSFYELIDPFFLAFGLSPPGDVQPNAQRVEYLLEMGLARTSRIDELTAAIAQDFLGCTM
jgi:hypothetical protein